MYDLLGQATIRDNDLDAYVDGGDNTDNVYKNLLVRSNENDLANTGRGVLTEIYLDNDKELITIVSINTYLAQADNDYNESTENISLTVYDNASGTTKLVALEDVPAIANLKKDDWVLVNWADETANKQVVDVFEPEIMENVEVTGFNSSKEQFNDYDKPDDATRRVTDITTGGTTYKNNRNAWYKQNTLNNYSTDRLVDKTYTLYMDQYGYFIGAELYSGADQYVFITGYDRPTSAIAVSTANANAIFTDGSMGTIKVNVTDTNKNIDRYNTANATTTDYKLWSGKVNHAEMWYTYTLRNDVYTLTPVANWTRHVAAQETTVQSNRVRLVPSNLTVSGDPVSGGTGNSYGDDASVYITVSMGAVDELGTNFQGNNDRQGITDIGGVYTGVQNVKLVYQAGSWAHSVYEADGSRIIAAIVLGEAEGVVDNYAFIRTGAYDERVERSSDARDGGDYTHYWKVDVIMNGKLETKEIKSKWESTAGNLVPGTVQELILDTDGYITKINSLPNSLGTTNTGTEYDDDNSTYITVAADRNKDKVYTNYDYKNNTRSTKPNSADLIDYSVYDINIGSDRWSYDGITIDNTYGAGAIGTTACPWSGSYTYANLSVANGTIVYSGDGLDFGSVANDVGLTYVSGAPAIVYHQVGNKMVYDSYPTVESAFRAIYDAASNVANGTNMKQFSGRVVAALDASGRAEWVFFHDYTPAPNSDPVYDQEVTGEKLSYNAELAEVNRLLAEGKNVVIDGEWHPSDLSATNKTLRLPRGRTLTVLGDFNTYLNNGSDTIVITQIGSGSKLGKIVVGQSTGSADVTGAKFTIMQDVDFDVQAQNMFVDHLSVAAGHIAFRTGTDVRVNRNLSLDNSIELDAYGTLTVGGDVVKGPRAGTPKVNVYANTTINGNLLTNGSVYSANTLIVRGSVGNASNNVTVNVGSGTGNGRAVVNTVASGSSVVVNNTTASTAATTVATNNGTVTVTKGEATVTANTGTASAAASDAALNITTVTGGEVTGADVTTMTGGTIKSGTVENIGKDASIDVANNSTVTVTGTLDTSSVTVSSTNGSLVLKKDVTIGENSSVVKEGDTANEITGEVKSDVTITNTGVSDGTITIPADKVETGAVKSPTNGQPTTAAEASTLAAAMPNLGHYITLGLTEEYTPSTSANGETSKGTIKLVGTVTTVNGPTMSEAAMTEFAPGNQSEITANKLRGWEDAAEGDETHCAEGFKTVYKLEDEELGIQAFGFIVVNIGGDDFEALIVKTNTGWKMVKRASADGTITLLDSIDVTFNSGKYTIDCSGLK